MLAAHVTERIHSVSTQREPYISCLLTESWMNGIDLSPLASIGGVSKQLISFIARLFKMPTHQFRVPRVGEQTLQACDHRQVPHDHRRKFSLLSRIGSSVFYLGRIIFVFTIIIALVSAPLAHRASIILFILLLVSDAVVWTHVYFLHIQD